MRRWFELAGLIAILATGCSYTPPRAELAAPPLAESTRIYDVEGRLITQLVADENRENIRLDELPKHLIDAVVAIEDDRFWDHKGVDLKAILRAAVTNTREGEIAQGGSTITQQYVKNALLDDARSINRKIREALLAVQLERSSTKERILELYLNTIYFGNGAYGVQAASQEYFDIPASEVDVAQAALLAALIRSPTGTDPYDQPTVAAARRDVVLDRMAELDILPEETAARAKQEALLVRAKPVKDRYPAAHFVENVKRFVLDDLRFGSTAVARRNLLFGGGLRIQTTLDLDTQAIAEYAVAKVRPPPPGPDAALISIEPKTGYVRALVGGRDFFDGGERAKLDLATGGPGRPAGSSFKPLVLAAAIEHGITLDRVYSAPSRLVIPLPTGSWEVENYEGEAGGDATLLDATVHSYNTVYAQVVMEVGPEQAMAVARNLGVKSLLLPYPSAVLGTNDVHPIDMATAYGTLANRGIEVDPVFVTRITTIDGTVLYNHTYRHVRAISQQTADEVTAALEQVVVRGTGTRARLADRPVAGKTGTGQEWRDAWFIGFTPDVVTAVWMGFAQAGQISMKPPATPIRVTGGSWPAMIWRLFMQAATSDTRVRQFPEVIPRTAAGDSPDLDEATSPTVPDVATPVVEVPNVLGLTEANAETLLEQAGFVVRVLQQAGGAGAGRVWAQSPSDTESAPIGSAVRIWVTPVPETTTSTSTTTTTATRNPRQTTTTQPPSG